MTSILVTGAAGFIGLHVAKRRVRYSLVDLHAYVEANLAGFVNILENCRRRALRKVVSGLSRLGSDLMPPSATSTAGRRHGGGLDT